MHGPYGCTEFMPVLPGSSSSSQPTLMNLSSSGPEPTIGCQDRSWLTSGGERPCPGCRPLCSDARPRPPWAIRAEELRRPPQSRHRPQPSTGRDAVPLRRRLKLTLFGQRHGRVGGASEIAGHDRAGRSRTRSWAASAGSASIREISGVLDDLNDRLVQGQRCRNRGPVASPRTAVGTPSLAVRRCRFRCDRSELLPTGRKANSATGGRTCAQDRAGSGRRPPCVRLAASTDRIAVPERVSLGVPRPACRLIVHARITDPLRVDHSRHYAATGSDLLCSGP